MAIYLNGSLVKQSKFPGGECHVNISGIELCSNNHINSYLKNSDDIMILLLTVDAIRRKRLAPIIILRLMYFPYSRQDRVCNEGEALSVRVMANLINALNLDEVMIFDPHSDVVGSLINNSNVVEVIDFIPTFKELKLFLKDKSISLVSPDAGAEKNIIKLSKYLGGRHILYGRKVRDTVSGIISDISVDFDVCPEKVLISDDICDGGGTFIGLSKALKEIGVKEVYLYVTNGIFSNGLDELKKHLNGIYCFNVFDQSLIDNKFLIADERNIYDN